MGFSPPEVARVFKHGHGLRGFSESALHRRSAEGADDKDAALADTELELERTSDTEFREESVKLFSYESAQQQQDTVSDTTNTLNNEQQHQQRERLNQVAPADELDFDDFQEQQLQFQFAQMQAHELRRVLGEPPSL